MKWQIVNITTLPHNNYHDELLLAAYVLAMSMKEVLNQWLCESIGDLILGLDWEYFDQSLPYMLMEVMIAHIDVLYLWT